MMRPFVSLALGVLLTAACGDHAAPGAATSSTPGQRLATDEVFARNAVVRYVPLEGGCWALDTERGSYEPVALPAQFRTNGLAVYAVFRDASGIASVCMVAPLVVLDTIRMR